MIKLETTFEDYTCTKCKTNSTALFRVEVYNYGTRIRKLVFDKCSKCGTKLSKQQEYDRELTSAEINKLYANGKTKLQVNEL